METMGIDHGNAAMKTRSFCFPAGVAEYEHEPYTTICGKRWLSSPKLEPERLKGKIFPCAVMKYDALCIRVNKKSNKTLDTDNADFNI